MQKQYSVSEIVRSIRPYDNCCVGRTSTGVWALYAVKDVCFIKERIDSCELVRWCSDEDAQLLDTLEYMRKIVCVPMSTSGGVVAIAKRLVS